MDQRGDEMDTIATDHYDESVGVSDGEEVPSTNQSPVVAPQNSHNDQAFGQSEQPQRPTPRTPIPPVHPRPGAAGLRRTEDMFDDDEEEEDSQESDSEEDEEADGPNEIQRSIVGGYDPAEYDHLKVSAEVKELFSYITRYTPQTIQLDFKLLPFVPEYIPAIGDIDAFLKVTRPDGQSDPLGLAVLDEPSVKQSDPNVLDLQLRSNAKQLTEKPHTVHSISDPHTNTKQVESWIQNIRNLRRQRHATNVHYTKNMPDLETLMQEWEPDIEQAIKDHGMPTGDLACDLSDYVDVLCSMLDIPVYGSRIHSLHVLFSLFMEFRDSQHFKKPTPALSKDGLEDASGDAES